MEKSLVYKIDIEYMREKGSGLCKLVKGWLLENKIDALVYDFILFEEANLIIDYSFDTKVSEIKVKGLIEQILNRFKIKFELEEPERL